jgi:hypothetical protein
LLGTWQLDLSKSKYSPGPAPRGETRTYARDDEGLKGTIRRRLADGREEVIEYRADFDHEYPVAVVSDDGQTLTIEFRREGGSAIHNVAVYRKQTQ